MKILFTGLIIGVIFLSGCVVEEVTEKDQMFIDKDKNMCGVDSDCEYTQYTGGCNTPEYVSGIMDKCKNGSGPCPSEAPGRDGVTCTCENNACITLG